MNISALLGPPPGEDHIGTAENVSARSNASAGLSLHRIWYTIRVHHRLIAIIMGVIVGIAIITQIFASPVYQATAMVQVELTDDQGANQAEASAKNAQRIDNEVSYFRSRAAMETLVNDLKLYQSPLFGGQAKAARNDEAVSIATDRLQSMVKVQNNQGSDIINIIVDAPKAALAAEIANQMPRSVQNLKEERRETRRDEVLTGLMQDAEELGQKVDEAEAKIALFRQEKDMLAGAGSVEDLAQINRIAVEATSAQGLSAAMSARSAGSIRAASIRGSGSATSPLLQQQQRRMDELQGEYARMSASLGPGHPEMININAQISDLQQKMSAERSAVESAARADTAAQFARESQLARSEASGAAARAGQLNAQLNRITAKAYANAANLAELSRLERAADIARNAYLTVAQRVEEVRIKSGLVGVNSILISAAATPREPILPKPRRTIATALAGSFILALMVVFTIELLDNRLRNAGDIRRLFGLRTIAMFPTITGTETRNVEESPVLLQPQSLFAEVARACHSEIHDLHQSDGPQTILITSALPGEGKSTVALSICAAASAMGRRAILLDLDLRRHGILNQIQQNLEGPDIAAILSGDKQASALLMAPPEKKKEREIVSYRPVVLSAREPVHDPASLLSKQRVSLLLSDLKERYDLIIINAPAALAVRDSLTLSMMIDNMFMVVKWGQTTSVQMRAALEMLNYKVDAAIFNQVDYIEHARRGYGDPIEFFVHNAFYFDDQFPAEKTAFEKFRTWAINLGRYPGRK